MSRLQVITPQWDAPGNVMAFTTTRLGGYSRAPWDGLNMAMHVGDEPSHVAGNRRLLRESLHLPSEPVWLEQVHGCDVAVAEEISQPAACDASMTRQAGIVCAVLTADCLPLLLTTRKGDQVAAVHAGWRGLAAGIIENTVKQFNTRDDEVLAWMGPAIGPGAFEVGPEVRQQFIDADPVAAKAFKPSIDDRWLCDIYHLARQKLHTSGVDYVSGGGLCAYSDSDRFYSYRRDGITGRMASLIWISP